MNKNEIMEKVLVLSATSNVLVSLYDKDNDSDFAPVVAACRNAFTKLSAPAAARKFKKMGDIVDKVLEDDTARVSVAWYKPDEPAGGVKFAVFEKTRSGELRPVGKAKARPHAVDALASAGAWLALPYLQHSKALR